MSKNDFCSFPVTEPAERHATSVSFVYSTRCQIQQTCLMLDFVLYFYYKTDSVLYLGLLSILLKQTVDRLDIKYIVFSSDLNRLKPQNVFPPITQTAI